MHVVFYTTHVKVVQHLVEHLRPVPHPLQLHVRVHELGLVLTALVPARRRQGLELA